MTAPHASPPPAGPRYSLGWVVGAFTLGVLAVLMAIGVLFTLASVFVAGRTPAATPTVTAMPLPPQFVLIPTTTPLALATAMPTPVPMDTSTAAPLPAETETPAPEGTAAATSAAPAGDSMLTADVAANVRSGPGPTYPVIAGLFAGQTAQVLGRDSSGTWYAIAVPGARDGRGWIAGLVSTYNGDVSSLQVLTAPPPPPAATVAAGSTAPPPAAPPAAPPAVGGTRGLTGRLTLCSGQTTFAVGERVCFIEWIRNNTAQAIDYGILGVQATNLAGGGQFQTSWSGELAAGGRLGIDPGCEGPVDRCNGAWEDGMRLSAPGSYRLTLQVCYSSFSDCLGGGDWEVLSAPIIITVN
jgi:hypothetical protein